MSTTIAQPDPRDLIADLVAHAVPVILCTPHRHRYGGRRPCGAGCDRELDQSFGWQQAEPDRAVIDRYQPGVHTPAMVTGHVLDAIDVDSKYGADVQAEFWRAVGCGVVVVGIDTTPSGGAHLFIPSAGVATAAKPSNGVDFRGGCADGSGRGLIYLPGSNRPKYPGLDYRVLMPIDWQRLAEVRPA